MVKLTSLCDVFDSPARFRQWIIKGQQPKTLLFLFIKNVTVNYATPHVGERGNHLCLVQKHTKNTSCIRSMAFARPSYTMRLLTHGVTGADGGKKKYPLNTTTFTVTAFELWNSGYHEAKLLSVLVFDKKDITHSDIEKLMGEVVSWDLCDHLCKNLIAKRKDYEEFIYKWIASAHTYKKRAAYTLMAASAIHDKKLPDDTLDKYLKLIKEAQDIEHEHI